MNKAAADGGGGAALQSDTEEPLMYKRFVLNPLKASGRAAKLALALFFLSLSLYSLQ